MTVPSEISSAEYIMNGVTVLYPVPFRFLEDSHLRVIRTDSVSGVDTILILNSLGADGYSVDGAGKPNGGSISVISASTSGNRLTITRNVPKTQLIDYIANDAFPAESHESGLDKLTMLIQQYARNNDRALTLFESDIDGSGRYNAKGNRIANLGDGIDPTDAVNLAQVTGLIGTGTGLFTQAGTGAVQRSFQNKAREWVTPEDFGAAGNGITDDTVAIQRALNASLGVRLVSTYLSGPLTLRSGQNVVGPGTIVSTGTGALITMPVGVTAVVLDGFEIVGTLLTNQSNVLDVGIYLPENGFTITDVRIRQFALAGIKFGTNVTPSLGVFERPNSVTNCKITRNGCGINTDSFEYVQISDCTFAENGFNAARSGFAPAVGAGPGCAGIAGNIANIAVKGNTFTSNAFGISLIAGSAAPNPDHNMIVNNTINHNMACGLYIAQNKNYELIAGNTILSTVTDPGAPTVVPIGGVARDMILIDAHCMKFTGNAIGSTDVYGQGRCAYINNVMLVSFVELSNPNPASPLAVTWGITINNFNVWRDNFFFGYTRPTLFAGGGAANIISGNIEGGSGLVDGVQFAPSISANWVTPSTSTGAYIPVRYWRESGNRVTVAGSVERTSGATLVPFVLPAGFRPAAVIDTPCVVSSSGTFGIIRIDSTGTVSIFTPTNGQPISFTVTFQIP